MNKSSKHTRLGRGSTLGVFEKTDSLNKYLQI